MVLLNDVRQILPRLTLVAMQGWKKSWFFRKNRKHRFNRL